MYIRRLEVSAAKYGDLSEAIREDQRQLWGMRHERGAAGRPLEELKLGDIAMRAVAYGGELMAHGMSSVDNMSVGQSQLYREIKNATHFEATGNHVQAAKHVAALLAWRLDDNLPRQPVAAGRVGIIAIFDREDDWRRVMQMAADRARSSVMSMATEEMEAADIGRQDEAVSVTVRSMDTADSQAKGAA